MPLRKGTTEWQLLLAAAAALLLLVGNVLRPKHASRSESISQSEVLRSDRDASRRMLDASREYFASQAALDAVHIVAYPSVQGAGLLWDAEGMVVTANFGGRLEAQPELVMPSGFKTKAAFAMSAEDLPIASARVTGQNPAPPRIALPDELPSGSWMLAVSRRPDGGLLFVPTQYAGSVPSTCGDTPVREIHVTAAFSTPLLGGALFDMNRNLAGLIVRCGGEFPRVAVIAAQSVVLLLKQLQAPSTKMLERYGMSVGVVSDDEAAYFGTRTGAIVNEVWEGSSAAHAGLTPGDIVTGVDNDVVSSPADLDRLLLPVANSSFDLRIVRGTKTIRIALFAIPTPEDAQAGIVFDKPRSGSIVRRVEPDSPAARAGLRPGDRVSLAGASPVFVTVERGRKVWGVLLQ